MIPGTSWPIRSLALDGFAEVEMFEEEKASLMPFLGPFTGFVEKPMRATTTCLIAHDRN
jgi:hypothetical protein